MKKAAHSSKKAPGYIHFSSNGVFFPASSVHKVQKEWGEEQWIVNKEYCGKKLVLKKNRRCSLHLHKEKDEVFYLLSGEVLLEIGTEKHHMKPGDFVHIKKGTKHRFTGLKDSAIMEFSTTHREDDSYRKELSGHMEPERFLRQSSLIDLFSSKHVLVIGDLMLDRYVSGKVTRISPEAPVPVVHVVDEWEGLGGAGNAARNARMLGATVDVCGSVGDDAAGKRLLKLCSTLSAHTHIAVIKKGVTTQKERIVNQMGQQLVRVDREVASTLTVAQEKSLMKDLRTAIGRADVVIVSDYAKGLLTASVLKMIIETTKKQNVPLIVDPKPRADLTLALLKGATLLTPNEKEARELTGLPHASHLEVGQTLSKKTGATVLLTRGGSGMDVFSGGTLVAHFDAHSPEVVDVSGAGDTVAVVTALALACGARVEDAADISNRAAGVVVGKKGAATLTAEELRAAL